MAAEAPKLSAEFYDFLIEAKRHGYGMEGGERLTLASGAHGITYEQGDWLYTDNYIGGEPYAGYEHVSIRDPRNENLWVPIWGMSYYGSIVNNKLTDEDLTKLLGEVLSVPERELPIRGPWKHFFMNQWGRYELRAKGSLEEFEANEMIGKNPQYAVYRAKFIGGITNRVAELERLAPKWLVQ